ncbi:uncharacterized protein BT62DRAFT_1002398 [Guyanagaster necrorhizus]|uniref:Uncharacterized protein n=1 Tax=Guyanagaster necrorhizus TaxID=856835 RepID=A0A9P7W103_9AGAR|nr:uncharacterized protein BT62DRAFT_1002398 [Guyanagaster necrorhizus MCA 3950]KAG7450060.1 hypothetical protein BT62DRAFT_1002398 [Guyanagaster necrorhizus MCA 3950]
MLSSGSNQDAGENTTASSLLSEVPESDDPLNALRSTKRGLSIQADNALQDNYRIHVKADVYSCMEIKDMLESLNCDVMQLAALMSDKLRFKHLYAKTLDELRKLHDAAENVQRILGRRVTELLMRNITNGMQSIVVQTVIHAVLAKTCHRLIQRWCMSNEEHNVFALSYKKFRATNSLEMAAQWRAKTREMTKYGPQSDSTRKFALREFIENLLDVLHIAGWKNSAPKECIEKLFGDRIRELVELTIRVDRAIMEGAMSQDLHIFMPAHDSIYDPITMVDIHKDPNAIMPSDRNSDLVETCISIGLKLQEKHLEKGQANDTETAVSRIKVLLKAKVVLNMVLGI